MRDALQQCPVPEPDRMTIRVTPPAERMLRQGHPWLYDQAIVRQSRDGQPGDLAVVFDRTRRFLAIGLYDPASPIRVRLLQHRIPALIDQAWYERRLSAALQRRAALASSSTTGYRLVHGENDGLPGVVIDRYEETLVVKLYTAAWIAHLRTLIPALVTVYPAKRIVLRLSRTVQRDTSSLCGLRDGMVIDGPPLDKPLVFREHGLTFEVDPVHGQKTGFFLDQRENRMRVEQLSAGKSVLDAFAYTGTFSVYAARGGAREVTSVDISRPALEVAQRNMQLNLPRAPIRAAAHHIVTGDTFEYLERLSKHRRRFDMVILDPPSFAKTRDEVRPALLEYGRLARLGLTALQPNGILVYSCCSGQVEANLFFNAIRGASAAVRVPLKELARTTQPLDHPISFKEGAYLKCMFATVPGASRLRRRAHPPN